MSPRSVDELFASLVGEVMPGGCDSCSAEQTMHEEGRGIWRLQVAHDDDCTELARHRGDGR